MNITFVFDDIIVQTTIDTDDSAEAVARARDVLADHGLQSDRAIEIQVDDEIYED